LKNYQIVGRGMTQISGINYLLEIYFWLFDDAKGRFLQNNFQVKLVSLSSLFIIIGLHIIDQIMQILLKSGQRNEL
jgi:hypothetical protein